MLGIIRSATTDPVAAGMLRAGSSPRARSSPWPGRSTGPTPTLRATLAGSQLVGLVMARYVVGVEPLASAPPRRSSGSIGPTIQRYLTGDLGPLGPATGSRSP